MSSSKNSNGTNGTITLKSFTELADVLDLESLPPGPPDVDDQNLAAADTSVTTTAAAAESGLVGQSVQPVSALPAVADLIARLAAVSSGLESMAREDARARQQATVELAQYETLAAERHEAERALAEARRVRATGELLVTEAFTEQARAEAARHAAVARAAELTCAQLLAERTRAADELASRPHLARVLDERRRREREQTEAAQRAEDERAMRLANTIAAAKRAQDEGRLDDARALLTSLARDFPTNREIQSVLDAVRWQSERLRTAPAEEALRDVLHHRYRDNLEAAVSRLAAIDMQGLPEDLARRIFGVWSHNCLQLVRQSGLHEPRRYSPTTSRGVVFARRFPDAPYVVVSSLGLPGWRNGEEVKAERIIDAARPLKDRVASSIVHS
jgi:hypothetical protein